MQLKLFIMPVKNVLEAEADGDGFPRAPRVLAVLQAVVDEGENSSGSFITR